MRSQSATLNPSGRIHHFIALMVLCCVVAACSGNRGLAPVRNLSIEPESEQLWRSGRYKVQKTDTLYSIAFRFGLDFQQLARINNIKKPYTIFPGQMLQLRYPKTRKQATASPNKLAKSSPKQPKSTTKSTKKQSKPTAKSSNKQSKYVATQQAKSKAKSDSNSNTKSDKLNSVYDKKKKVTGWQWPVKNKDPKYVSSGRDKKQGINIFGRLGQPIRAAADGRVVYSGNGLVGYGNLIIIKHSQSFLSAYAHNERIDVKEKDIVKAGQKIATMGKNDTGKTQLHFEIRYQGRPVNPLKYLPSSN